MKRILISLVLALLLVLCIAVPVFADAGTYQDVTVTATPCYVAISCDPLAWTLNDIVGDGVTPKGTITNSDVYYSNPQGDGTEPSSTVDTDEGYFVITNTSTVNITLTVDMENFSGGDANMTNGETGSPGASSYGAYSWYEGMTYSSKVVVKKYATGSSTLWTSSSPGDDIDIGVEVATQTGAFSGTGQSSTSTLKITAAPVV
jgi:hypothetical protein